MPRTILIPIDFSQQDAGAKALAEARRYDPDGKLVLLHVIAPIPSEVALDIPANRQAATAPSVTSSGVTAMR